jgi:hypothetical protein
VSLSSILQKLSRELPRAEISVHPPVIVQGMLVRLRSNFLWEKAPAGWRASAKMPQGMIAIVQKFDPDNPDADDNRQGLVLCVTSLGTGWVRRELVDEVT